MISAPVIEYLKKGIFTILGLMLAVYLFIILMTYTGNDPSWSHISSDMTTVNNMGGAMGAWLSDLLYSFFGFGAWWLLAFLIYESILIWWNNKPTFWVLRLVSYVFLLLSVSALFAQWVTIIQQITDPAATTLKGIAGGIVGLELQARLAQLLSTWGSVAFLSVFVVIIATFAFNVHWLALYHQLVNLSWFGSGIKDEDNTQPVATQNSSEQDTDEHLVTNNDKKLITDKFKKQKSDYGGQLPLELQPINPVNNTNDNRAADNNGRFGHVLTDFLAKSGLGDSVKASMAAAQAATTNKMMNDSLQPATAASSSSPSNNRASDNAPDVNVSAAPLARKVEPSFAWNDSGMVDNLLATESIHERHTPEPAASVAAPSYQETQVDIKTESTPITVPPPENLAPVALEGNKVADVVDNDTLTTAIDELADTWLAENEAMTGSSPSTTNTHSETIEPKRKYSVEVPTASVPTTTTTVIEPETKAQTVIAKPSVEVVTESLVADMTPTNTPPANPKEAPTATPKPNISFAVPDGDSSNHISDMMPEDDSSDLHVPVMPDIHDDAAFTQRSRSMQTAKYRDSLTPIPEMSLLDKPDPDRQPSYTIAELEQLSELLEIKLQEFNVKAEVVNAIPGPVVTRFEVDLAAGIKASKVTGISRDLARSLSMASLRVVEVIPGKPYIGIEVPNKQREMVRLIELLDTEKFKDPKAQISMAMGKDIGGKPIITDLARAPHMLVAGTTGSGKSVLVNSMLLSMLLKYTPNELRLILIDPKQLELANYNDIPHLLTPVVTDMTEAASSLSWCVAEMERRYQLMSLLKVRKLNEFNKKVIAAEKAGKPMLDPLWRPNDNVSIDQAPKLKTLPMIVIVADEFADMIMQVGKQAEELITRLAQKSRAAGIHLMLATQRPSVDVITGLIKANIPVRAALRVNSKVDSRTILDSGGAEDMLGNGDMLFLGPGQIEPDRVHGAYVSDEEVNRVCDAWRERGAPDYIDNMAGNFELSSPGGSSTGSSSGEDDDLYNEAVGFIMETRKVSASSIQRKFSIGYNRAARIVDSMEEAGLVSSMGKSGKRELLM